MHRVLVLPPPSKRVILDAGCARLFGDVHELRPVSTHAPVPELALEKIACSVDCPGLNRDPCWLEANKCGECVDGFDGKAGHVNSPCGKVRRNAISNRVLLLLPRVYCREF